MRLSRVYPLSLRDIIFCYWSWMKKFFCVVLFTYYLYIRMSFSSASASLSLFFLASTFPICIYMSSLLLIFLFLSLFNLAFSNSGKLAEEYGGLKVWLLAIRYGDDNSTWFTPSLQINFHNCARVFFPFSQLLLLLNS